MDFLPSIKPCGVINDIVKEQSCLSTVYIYYFFFYVYISLVAASTLAYTHGNKISAWLAVFTTKQSTFITHFIYIHPNFFLPSVAL